MAEFWRWGVNNIFSTYQITISDSITYNPSSSWTGSDWVDAAIENAEVSPGTELKLPDGSILKVDDKGNYIIEDNTAVVTYKANRLREFNKFINTSDLLEMFIKEIAKLGVEQKDFMNLPIELFIKWLVIKAAEEDGFEAPDKVQMKSHPALASLIPRCKACGRFISKKRFKLGILFCNSLHLERYERVCRFTRYKR